MALIHNNALRVNAEVPDETVPIWREQGWASGKHKETDPDDDSAVPLVLPVAEPELEPKTAAKADTKKKD